MNSLMMIPKKSEYLMDEVKKEILEAIVQIKSEYQSDIKELSSYMQTLHTDMQASETNVQQLRIKAKNLSSQETVTNLSLEIGMMGRKIDELVSQMKMQPMSNMANEQAVSEKIQNLQEMTTPRYDLTTDTSIEQRTAVEIGRNKQRLTPDIMSRTVDGRTLVSSSRRMSMEQTNQSLQK